MSATVSVAHALPLAPAIVAMATATAVAGLMRLLRGLPGEMRALTGDLATAQATPMTIRVAVRATGAAAEAVRLPEAWATPDRCPVLSLAPDGRAAA